MTQLRNCKCENSNYFDDVLSGIGHRGSSFSDIDAVTHDGRTQRFLLQEFKREGEKRDKAQHWMLRDLASTLKKIPDHFTVWTVERRADGTFGWAVYGDALIVISREEYRAVFAAWWANTPYTPKPIAVAVAPSTHRVGHELHADEIAW